MAPTFRLKFTGGPELARALERPPKAVQGPVLAEALTKAAEPVIEEAERRAPQRRSPQFSLASHIEAQTTHARDKRMTVVIGPDSDHFYGLFLEFGTRFMPPRPFLRPAWDSKVEESLATLVSELGASIEKAAAREGGGE